MSVRYFILFVLSFWLSPVFSNVCLHPLEQAALFHGKSKPRSMSSQIRSLEKELTKIEANKEKVEDKIEDLLDGLANSLKENDLYKPLKPNDTGDTGDVADLIKDYIDTEQSDWEEPVNMPWSDDPDKYFKSRGRVDDDFCDEFANDRRDCEKAIKNLGKYLKVLDQLNEKTELVEDEMMELQDRQMDIELGLAEEETEASGLCFECLDELQELNKPTSGQILGNALSVIAGGALSYYGYKAGKRGAQSVNNMRMRQGFESLGTSGPSWAGASLGMPFIANGVYGFANGGSAFGNYSCSPGFAGGAGMYSPFYGYGGGFPGMGGGFGGGFPGMGGGFGGGFPGMGGGFAMGGFPGIGGGFPGGFGGGFPGMGGGFGGGFPGMGGGFTMGGFPGIGGGFPGGFGGGFPGMGGGFGGGFPGMGGGFGGGFPGMGGGFTMGGFPGMGGGFGGGFPGMGGGFGGGFPGMGGGFGGGFPGMGGGFGGGFPGMGGGMMGPGFGGGFNPYAQAQMQAQQYRQQQYASYMKFQQAQMQAQVQAQQAWLQHQQSIQQDWMQRQQVIGGLTQELYKIQQQIQLVASGGVGSSSVLGASGASISAGINLGTGSGAPSSNAPIHNPTPGVQGTPSGGDLPIVPGR